MSSEKGAWLHSVLPVGKPFDQSKRKPTGRGDVDQENYSGLLTLIKPANGELSNIRAPLTHHYGGKMIDAYLQIEGVKGESTDEKHKNWIEVSRVIGSVHQPRAASVSTAGGHTSGRAELSVISLEKLADLSSPVLRQHCAMGKTIPKAVFEFMRADGDGKPICYEKIILNNVMISGVTYESGDGTTMREKVELAYSRINWEHVKQSIRGGTEGSTLGGWDCAANKPC